MSDPRAHQAVLAAIRKGLLAPVTSLQCVDCGACATAYDHYRGYAREHWLDVEPVCDSHNSKRAQTNPARGSDQSAILVRLGCDLLAAIDDEADLEFRSRNAQIEWILRERYRARGLQIKEDPALYCVDAA